MNDTIGFEGLLPSNLMYGCIFRFPSKESTVPTEQQRMSARLEARREITIITAELRIRTACSSCDPRNTDLVNEVGDLVRLFSETDKRCVGPYTIIRIHGTHISIIGNPRKVKFNKNQVISATKYHCVASSVHFITTLHSTMPKS